MDDYNLIPPSYLTSPVGGFPGCGVGSSGQDAVMQLSVIRVRQLLSNCTRNKSNQLFQSVLFLPQAKDAAKCFATCSRNQISNILITPWSRAVDL